ncbi:endonuclease III [Candidatus Uhrbacteria bacterium]|nr:endonuclease III [Candidatus Uhrbacteria bacterium]
MKRVQSRSIRLPKILSIFKKTYGRAHCMLEYKTPWQLLAAVQLSAQCTDVMVNKVTPALFAKYPTAEATANAPIEEIERLIHYTGFYHNKAKSLKGAAQMVVEKFGGQVPAAMDELLELPGVARKTANVILGNAFGVVEGIAVDTHVSRVSQRLGLTTNTNPEKIEKDLMRILAKKEWFDFTYRIIDHGRAVCKAPTPRCEICLLNQLCPSSTA